ncbi:MAG: hypothetical protein CMF94_02800 [Candidatus Marinimicrobia bacterium]|nr:hypothetical protein [Candidatus Neomarinimicrobiota bacterium]
MIDKKSKLTDSRKQKSTLNSFLSFQKVINQAGPAASASYALIASLLIFTFIGYRVDNSFDSSPIGLVIGIIFGLVIGFYQLFKTFIWKQNKF